MKTKIIRGTDKQLYDMAIEYYDYIHEGIKNFEFIINLETGSNMIRLKEFVSLINEINEDCKEGECDIKFKIAKDNNEE